MGFPSINVEKLNSNTYIITQNRFLSNPDDYQSTAIEPSPYNYKWSIPLTYFDSQSVEVQRVLFDYSANEITINLDTSTDWIKFNKDQVGFYRVNYSKDIWKALRDALTKNINVSSFLKSLYADQHFHPIIPR